jgi:hypothetical protein
VRWVFTYFHGDREGIHCTYLLLSRALDYVCSAGLRFKAPVADVRSGALELSREMYEARRVGHGLCLSTCRFWPSLLAHAESCSVR